MSDTRIRIAAGLVVLGLLVELLMLGWSHPTAFLVFFMTGGLLLGCGILIFLTGLLRRG